MRFVLCDDDEMFRTMAESIVTRAGHDIVGVADSTSAAYSLVELAKPDVAIVDLSVDFNSDFDVISAAMAAGAQVIVFSFQADQVIVSQYARPPLLVTKPDFNALERVIKQLKVAGEPGAPSEDRRRKPARSAYGPTPSSLGDVQAFYEALNLAVEGDALLSVTVTATSPFEGGEGVANHIASLIRGTDRVLVSPSALRILLAGADVEGTVSLISRINGQVHLPPDSVVRSVVLAHGESGAEAFERLKHA